jgi:PEP-CTERM motif
MKAWAMVASLVIVIGLAPVAQGTPVTIEFAGTHDPVNGTEIVNSSIFTEGAFSVTVDAFAAKQKLKSLTPTDYQTGRLWQWSGPTTFGLGDCNRAERCGGRKGGTDGEVDNTGSRFDILRIHVDSAGTPIDAIGLSKLQQNDDFAIYGSDDPFPNLFALTPLATGNGQLGPDQDIVISQQFVYYFVLGKLGGRNDDFVVRNIVDSPAVDTPASSVPEPGTLPLMASGVTGLVMYRARYSRRRSSAAELDPAAAPSGPRAE